MKTEEDEAFDDLARKQGMWGGGFQAKRQAAMDKINSEFHEEYIKYRTAFPKEYTAPQPTQEPVTHLWECLGRWSAYLVENGKQADCAPPSWLVDAINKATTPPLPAQEPDALTIAYQSGYYDGKQAALAGREWNFCERCGKRTADKTVIHTCTPPQ